MGLVTLGTGKDMNPVTVITFICAAIHFPAVYNLSSKVNSSHTMYIYMVWEVKYPLKGLSVGSGFLLLNPMHHITTMI